MLAAKGGHTETVKVLIDAISITLRSRGNWVCFQWPGMLQNLDSGLWTGPWTGIWTGVVTTITGQSVECRQQAEVALGY